MSAKKLLHADLDNLMKGACFLGSGGGGSLKMAEQVRDALYKLPPVTMVDLKDVGDDANLCFIAGVGAPSADQPFDYSPLYCLEELEQRAGKSVQYVIPGETGAMNSLLPLLAAARSKNGLRVVNADGAGRALPQLQMCTYALGGVACNPAVIANENRETVTFRANRPDGLDRKVRELITKETELFSGAAMLASFAMTGKQVKSDGCCVKSAPRIAIDVGEALAYPLEARTKQIEKILKDHGRSAMTLMKGQVSCFGSEQRDGFDVGHAIVTDKETPSGCFVELYFVNENLAARLHLGNNIYSWMAPMMFCYLSPEGVPLSNADLASKWKQGERNIPIILFRIQPDPAIDTDQERYYFYDLYVHYFGPPSFEYHKEPDWDAMMADAAHLKTSLRFSRA